MCECNEGWTGPHCLAHEGRDPILYDAADKISDIGFIPPLVAPRFLFGILVLLAIMVTLALQCRRKLDGWTPLPDIDEKLFEQSSRILHHRQM